MGIMVVGRYYKTKKAALKALMELNKVQAKHLSVVEFKNGYLMMGNDQIEAINSKYYE